MYRNGFILNWRGDLVWFLGLPFLAIAAALASQRWLPAVALVSITLWVTVPHHFATWWRTYGLNDDWRRWRLRLLLGPLLIFGLTMSGLAWFPLTLLIVITLWDHQHSIMQQYGFSRIYDFKARTGTSSTARFDLLLNWTLYVNLFLTAPLFTKIWLRELYHWDVPVTAEGVRTLQVVSWTVTGVLACLYLGHVVRSLRNGHAVNPVKYAFLGASYFLWYFVSWQTASVLVYGIAHRLMHGLQYIVIVFCYVGRKVAADDDQVNVVTRLIRPGNVVALVAASVAYAIVYQLIVSKPLDEFGFGVVNFTSRYDSAARPGLEGMTPEIGYDLFAGTMVGALAMTHYYFDAFIWKVRDTRTQQGL